MEIALAGRVGSLCVGGGTAGVQNAFSGGMPALRIVMLLAAVPVCYLLFFHSQPAGKTNATPEAHSQYKRDMDQAHEAAKQMQGQRAEADSIQ